MFQHFSSMYCNVVATNTVLNRVTVQLHCIIPTGISWIFLDCQILCIWCFCACQNLFCFFCFANASNPKPFRICYFICYDMLHIACFFQLFAYYHNKKQSIFWVISVSFFGWVGGGVAPSLQVFHFPHSLALFSVAMLFLPVSFTLRVHTPHIDIHEKGSTVWFYWFTASRLIPVP